MTVQESINISTILQRILTLQDLVTESINAFNDRLRYINVSNNPLQRVLTFLTVQRVLTLSTMGRESINVFSDRVVGVPHFRQPVAGSINVFTIGCRSIMSQHSFKRVLMFPVQLQRILTLSNLGTESINAYNNGLQNILMFPTIRAESINVSTTGLQRVLKLSTIGQRKY